MCFIKKIFNSICNFIFRIKRSKECETENLNQRLLDDNALYNETLARQILLESRR